MPENGKSAKTIAIAFVGRAITIWGAILFRQLYGVKYCNYLAINVFASGGGREREGNIANLKQFKNTVIDRRKQEFQLSP